MNQERILKDSHLGFEVGTPAWTLAGVHIPEPVLGSFLT